MPTRTDAATPRSEPENVPVRIDLAALLLTAAACLAGCDSSPPDPYANVRMLTPAELGTTGEDQDPVQQAEKDHNSQFARDPKGR